MFSPMIAFASAITLVSAQNAKPDRYWRKDLRTLTGASDETWLRPGNGVIVEGDKVAVTTQDCSLIILDKHTQSGTVYSHNTSDDCSSAPIVRGQYPNQVFMYTTSDGNVIAVNADGTEAWKTQVDIWGHSILSLSKTWGGMYAAHNAGDGAYITFIDHDGIVDQNRSVHIPRVQMYPMSAAWSGFLDLRAPEWFYFCVSTVTGGNYYLYKLSATTDAAEVERVGTMNHFGGHNTPIVSNDHDAKGHPYPYPKVWTTIQTAPAGFIGKNKSEPDWQLEPSYDGSNTNSLTLTEEGNLCFCSLKFCRCVDSLYGTTEWKKNLVDNSYIGNPNLYVPKSNPHTADATLLINNLMASPASGFAKVTSVDPATGEVLWQLYYDDFHVSTADAGGGSMDYNDGSIYFSPVKYWVVATAARLSDGTKTFGSTDSPGSGSSCKICENCDEEITKDNITEIVLGVSIALAVVAIVVLAVLLCQQSKGFSELSQRGSA